MKHALNNCLSFATLFFIPFYSSKLDNKAQPDRSTFLLIIIILHYSIPDLEIFFGICEAFIPRVLKRRRTRTVLPSSRRALVLYSSRREDRYHVPVMHMIRWRRSIFRIIIFCPMTREEISFGSIWKNIYIYILKMR